ncbi:hypothetical protein [Helicobacter sp. 23-1045]
MDGCFTAFAKRSLFSKFCGLLRFGIAESRNDEFFLDSANFVRDSQNPH